MKAWLKVTNIAWLKNRTDLEGNLTIFGQSNLKDAQHANMRNKCKLETLHINCGCGPDYEFGRVEPESMLEITLNPEISVDVADFSWLESLQPHPNLKKLEVGFYSSATVPGWMCDPCSLQSIQEIWLDNFDKIQSLPFNNLHTLKHLIDRDCHGFEVLQLEQLPSQLEELKISDCLCLELITGLGNLNMLATLTIFGCDGLKSIAMDGLQLVESTVDDSSHGKPHIGRQSISTITRLEIKDCELLYVLPDGLIPSIETALTEPFIPYVRVLGCGCTDIEIGDLQ